jgi:hypothetical protein
VVSSLVVVPGSVDEAVAVVVGGSPLVVGAWVLDVVDVTSVEAALAVVVCVRPVRVSSKPVPLLHAGMKGSATRAARPRRTCTAGTVAPRLSHGHSRVGTDGS